MSDGLPAFDRLMEIAQKDPAQLEAIRRREIEILINSAPKGIQRRLRGLQFQIDCKRRLQSSPLGACIAISQMMLESLDRLNTVLQGEVSEPSSAPTSEDRSAKLLRFPNSSR